MSAVSTREVRVGVGFLWFWHTPELRRAMGLILVFALSAFLLLPPGAEAPKK